MNHAVTALLTFIATFILIAKVSTEFDKDSAKAGFVIIDKVAYRLVRVEP